VGSIPIPGIENKRLTACPISSQNPKNGPVVLVLYLLQEKTPIGNLIKAEQGMNCLFCTGIQVLLQNDAINRERGIRCVEAMSCSGEKSGKSPALISREEVLPAQGLAPHLEHHGSRHGLKRACRTEPSAPRPHFAPGHETLFSHPSAGTQSCSSRTGTKVSQERAGNHAGGGRSDDGAVGLALLRMLERPSQNSILSVV